MPKFSLAEIAERIGGMVEGDASVRISGVKPLADAGPGDLTVVSTRAEIRALGRSAVSAAVVPATAAPVGKPIVRVREPRLALAWVLELFHSRPREVVGIDPRAVIASDVRLGRDVNIAAGAHVAGAAEIGDRVDIYPGVYIGERVRIGDDSVIFANVSVYADTVIGKRVRVHSGVVIGSDGFGYTAGPLQELYKIPQVGSVEIEDDVEIGANTTIDRATMTVTRVGRGTKIDNLVQIAHNVEVGEHVCIVAQAGVAGSVRIGSRAVLGASAGLIDHIDIGAGARIGARAGVHRDVPAGATFIGTPAIPGHQAVRAYPLIAELPEYRRRIKELEERCARLEAALNERPRS